MCSSLYDDKPGLLSALDLYHEKKIDFIDVLLAVRMAKQDIRGIFSFDTHFDRLPDINRLVRGQSYE